MAEPAILFSGAAETRKPERLLELKKMIDSRHPYL
jgi:hypothetical protein